jgi:hypothetical protein
MAALLVSCRSLPFAMSVVLVGAVQTIGCEKDGDLAAGSPEAVAQSAMPPLDMPPAPAPENVGEKCAQLKKVMTRGVQAIDDGMASLTEDPKSLDVMEKMASTVSSAGREAVAVKAMDGRLQQSTSDYLNATQGVAKAIAELSASVEEDDVQRIQNAQRDLEEAAKSAKEVLEQMSKSCGKT